MMIQSYISFGKSDLRPELTTIRLLQPHPVMMWLQFWHLTLAYTAGYSVLPSHAYDLWSFFPWYLAKKKRQLEKLDSFNNRMIYHCHLPNAHHKNCKIVSDSTYNQMTYHRNFGPNCDHKVRTTSTFCNENNSNNIHVFRNWGKGSKLLMFKNAYSRVEINPTERCW